MKRLTIAHDMKRTLFKLQRLIGRFPSLYYPLYSILGNKKCLAVQPNTEIVIEGFPRSANSFAVVAFEQAQQHPVKIAHHLHIPAQIIKGVKMKIPVLVLVREPVSAICSLVVREPYLDLETALNDYINFYQTILPIRNNILAADFEEVTSNFGNVISNVNYKFNTAFSLFRHETTDVDNVFINLDALEKSADGTLTDETKVARPSTQRTKTTIDISNALSSRQYKDKLEKALRLYSIFRTSDNQTEVV